MEVKFKIMVLRVLMMILYKLAFPGKDSRDNHDVEKISMEVHNFIRTMDELQRAAQAQIQEPTPDRPPIGRAPSAGITPARPPLRMQKQA